MTYSFRLPGTFDSRDAETSLLWEAGCVGLEEKDGFILAYFARPLELPLAGEWQELAEVDWLKKYFDELRPVRVGRLIVSPTHQQPELGEGDLVLWLDPGMAFGTGHHVTTRLALSGLQELGVRGERVLDVGAGSGILAIAADLLGAASALGVDTDAATLPVAEANCKLNGSRAAFRVGSLDGSTPEGSVDVLVANLFAELHAELAPHYARALAPAGTLLATGILEDRLGLVLAALSPTFACEARLEDGWALVTARK